MSLFDIFGWRKNRGDPSPVIKTPVTPIVDGSSTIVNTSNMSGYYGYSFDLDGLIKDEIQTINRYREISSYPDCDTAIEQIVNEAVIVEDVMPPVSISLDQIDSKKFPDSIKNKIIEEFDTVLSILDFQNKCHDIFKRWYIDGRIYYYVSVDPKNPKKGIQDIQYIDPCKIKKITEVTKETINQVEIIKGIETYYVFSDKGLGTAQKGIKLSPDSIIDVPSGLVDANSGCTISHLFKAIKPVNQLKMMEDALVIYRIVRAPERRVFYVDTGNLPPQRAEQFVQNIMQKFRNKVTYDIKTGEVKDTKQFMSMMEDYFLPRVNGGRATEIQTLPSGGSLSDIDDIRYFQNKLYQALGVPKQRIMPDAINSLGRTSEVTREEILFSKFVQRLRNNFNGLFKQALRIQLLSKNIMSSAEWDKIANLIQFKYQHDNYFEELKRLEILTERMNVAQTADGMKEDYFSKRYIATNILNFTELEWKEMQKEIKKDRKTENETNDSEFNDINSDTNSE